MSELKEQFRIIPPHLRQLQGRWFPTDTYPKVEGIIRFGGRVADFEGRRLVMNWLSGGAGTMLWQEAGTKTAHFFNEISKDQYHSVIDEKQSRDMLVLLSSFLGERGVCLKGGRGEAQPSLMNHQVISEMLIALDALPASHFGHSHFQGLHLGGWGGGAAKCSAYDDPDVLIFSFATQGPVRNLWALMLHEIGHSFGANLPRVYFDAIDKARRKLVELGASYGVDYLFGEKERAGHYLSSTEEFIADTYMMYVTQGAFTPEGMQRIADIWEGASPDMLSRHHNFLESISPQARRIWDALWKLYRKCFEGIEYV